MGYVNGYTLSDDGELLATDARELEILAEITALRDGYQEALDQYEADICQKAEEELEAAEAGYLAAEQELEGLMQSELLAVEEAITNTTLEIETIFVSGSEDCAADAAAARQALLDFIDGRREIWAELSRREEATAKWQEDSYYRFNLLRLLDAKQDAVDAGIAEALEDFDAAMAALKEGAMGDTAAQRESWTSFTSSIRNTFAEGQAMVDEAMSE